MGAMGCFYLVSSLVQLLPSLQELWVRNNLLEPDWTLRFLPPIATYNRMVSLRLDNVPTPLCAMLLFCVPSLQRLTLFNDTFETAPLDEFDVQQLPSFHLSAYTYIGRDFAFARLPILSSVESLISLRLSTANLYILHALETQPHGVRALFLEPPASHEADVALLRRFIRACRNVRELYLRHSTVRDLVELVQNLAAPLRVLALDRPPAPIPAIHDTAHAIAQVLAHANTAGLQVLALPDAIIRALREYYDRDATASAENTIFDECRRRRIRVMSSDECAQLFFAAHAAAVCTGAL